MSRWRLAVVGFALAAATGTGAWMMRRALAPTTPVRPTTAQGERLLRSVMGRLQASYVDALTEDELWAKAAAGLVGELGDANSAYLRAERAQRLAEQTRGSYGGVGLQVDLRDGRVMVLGVRPGGPAERAGIQPGDQLVEADGRPFDRVTLDEARAMVRGAPGSDLTLTLKRGGARIPVTLTRSEIHVRSVTRAQRLPDGAGYLALTTFNDSAATEVAATVDSLVRAGATGLVLDLRGNPGGLLAQGVAVADLFLDRGQRIAEIRGRDLTLSRAFDDGAPQRWPTLPIVVLVNAATASAAEIVAGALQDHDRAAVLGRTSFGKGSAQSVYPLAGGNALKLTTARWLTPSGRHLDRQADSTRDDGVAVEPDRPVFRTDAGRRVLGGGGIVPDLAAGDTLTPPAERALMLALGTRLAGWRDAVAAAAAAAHRRAPLVRVDADVPPLARALLWDEVSRRSLPVTRGEVEGAPLLVDRMLGAELARLAFGLPAVGQRATLRDPVVREAALLLRDAASPAALLAKLNARVAAKPAA